MGVSYDGGFLTKAKGEDDIVIKVTFNNGKSRPMKCAKKRCLNDALTLWKKLHHRPSKAEWQTEPHFFSLDTIVLLFGSYDKMLEEAEKRKRPSKPDPNLNTVKVTRMAKNQRSEPAKKPRVEPKQVDAEPITLESKKEKGNTEMAREQVQPASVSKSQPEPEVKPNLEPISNPKSKSESEPKLESQPEINLATSCYKLVNTLGYNFSIGPLHIEASHSEGRAVIEKTQLITGKSDLVTSSQLKLALEIPGQLIDFPAPQEGVFYLIDAKLCHEMGPLSLSDRHDLIPVYHQDNFPPDTQYRNLYGLHVFIDD